MVIALAGLALLQGGSPEVITRSRVDPRRGVDFHALVVPETVYVGQQATYQLGVFLDQDTRQRIRRNPEFQPPETRSLMSYDLREPGNGAVTGTIAGRPYEIHVFRRALFPLTPGRYSIPAARLTYALPQTSSFFSREESYSLRAEGVDFVAVEPPAAGRPSDWAGAVGSWSAAARVDTLRGRTGEPFVLTLRVTGQGNVTLLPRPHIAIPWATVVNADERVRLDSAPPLLGGAKEFDWLVTPRDVGTLKVPALRYAFFNPRARRYEVATTTPFDVRVVQGAVAAATDFGGAPALPPPSESPFDIRGELGRETGAPLGAMPVVLVLVVLAPIVAAGAWWRRRPRRVKPAPTPVQRLAAIGERGDADAVRDVRRLLGDGLRARTGLDGARLTAPGAWTMALRKVGVTAESAAATEALIEALDAASFSSSPSVQPPGAGWAAQAREALRLVDAEACRPGTGAARWTPRVRGVAVLVGMAAVATAAWAAAGDDPQASFAQGATAYAGGDYVRAARHFEDAARLAPRAANAWANLGTASFLAHDTARAALGWQRALRLAPLDAETRTRLMRIRAPQESGLARVPAVPARLPSALALLLWVGGWGVAARQAWRRRPMWRVAALTAVVGGTALAGARALERRFEGDHLVIVMGAAPLRVLPALGADAGSTPIVGEVAVVTQRSGAWVAIRLDGGRAGWIPAERVAALGGN
jgi:hypothetical protein